MVLARTGVLAPVKVVACKQLMGSMTLVLLVQLQLSVGLIHPLMCLMTFTSNLCLSVLSALMFLGKYRTM